MPVNLLESNATPRTPRHFWYKTVLLLADAVLVHVIQPWRKHTRSWPRSSGPLGAHCSIPLQSAYHAMTLNIQQTVDEELRWPILSPSSAAAVCTSQPIVKHSLPHSRPTICRKALDLCPPTSQTTPPRGWPLSSRSETVEQP